MMEKRILTNKEVQKLASDLCGRISYCEKGVQVYGIPRGGVPVAYLVSKMLGGEVVDHIEEADLIVDDLIDSGSTMQTTLLKCSGNSVIFEALIRKKPGDPWIVFPWEKTIESSIEDSIIRQLQYIGEDVMREGLRGTPDRVIRSWEKLYGGYLTNPKELLESAIFEDGACDEMVLLRDIEFYSTCEHHMLPFFGKVHIGYIPSGKVVGVSKLARLVECFARRLQIQERLTESIAKVIDSVLNPKGVAVVIEAQHTCMTSRGVEKQNSIMTTSSMLGVLRTSGEARSEFLNFIR